MSKIAILQQIIPKYRVSFFNELNKYLDFELYSSTKGLEKSIYTITENTNFKINIVKKFIFMNKFIFQFLPFRGLFLKKIVIFEFNIRIFSSVLLLLMRIIFKKKNILWTHGVTENMSIISKSIRIFFLKRATNIFVYENAGKNNLIKLGVADEMIFVLKNSINIRQIDKFIDNTQKKNRITFIGRITKEKNVNLLCKAFLNILDRIDSTIILTIIGNGEELNILKKKFDNSRIKFIGYLAEEEKISYYLNQTLFTVSPDYLGLAIVHSFSYSVPILVNKYPKQQHSPEIELLQNNKNGWYFNGSQKDLENQIIKFLNKKKILNQFGNEGLRKIKKEYGVELMAMRFLQAIKR